jgi:REP element-mobilizing transposase RayT
MVHYRRNFVPGGTFFFTVTLDDRRSSALVDHVTLLRAAFRKTRSERPFVTDAIVILPDHLHAILTLPPGDSDFQTGGDGSREASRGVSSLRVRQFRAIIAVNIPFGKSAFGSTPFVMNGISNAAPITYISTRSSTG